jgi:hypothetical protein
MVTWVVCDDLPNHKLWSSSEVQRVIYQRLIPALLRLQSKVKYRGKDGAPLSMEEVVDLTANLQVDIMANPLMNLWVNILVDPLTNLQVNILENLLSALQANILVEFQVDHPTEPKADLLADPKVDLLWAHTLVRKVTL